MTLINIKPKNLSIWFLGLLMILIPMQYYAEQSFGALASRISQQQLLQVASIVLFAMFVLNNIYLSLFLVWSCFLYGYFGFPIPIGVALLTILSGCMIYEAVYRTVNRENVDLIFKFMCWFAAINLIYMVAQGFGWELLFSEQSAPGIYQQYMLGFMCLKAIMGMFFAMVMPLLAFQYPKLALGLFIPIYVSECSSAMVAGIAAYLWNLWHISRKWFYIALTVMILGGTAYSIHDSSAGMFVDRFNMWKVVLRDAVKKPIFGWGIDSFRCITPEKQFMYWRNDKTLETSQVDVKDTIEYTHTGSYDLDKYKNFLKKGDGINPWDNPHNEYIQLFYEFGIVGVILLGGLAYDMRRRFNTHNIYLIPLFGFFISLAIMSIGQFPLHLARVGFYVPIFLACYYKLSESA